MKAIFLSLSILICSAAFSQTDGTKAQTISAESKTKAIGPKQDDPRSAVKKDSAKKVTYPIDRTKQDDLKKIDPNDPKAIGPKQDDPQAAVKKDAKQAIGPKQDDPLKKFNPNDPKTIGPKLDDPKAAVKKDSAKKVTYPIDRGKKKIG